MESKDKTNPNHMTYLHSIPVMTRTLWTAACGHEVRDNFLKLQEPHGGLRWSFYIFIQEVNGGKCLIG